MFIFKSRKIIFLEAALGKNVISLGWKKSALPPNYRQSFVHYNEFFYMYQRGGSRISKNNELNWSDKLYIVVL